MSIQVNQLTKVYGRQRAVNALSFEVTPGDILGFLGPNGAGKSTTMKVLTGYIPPTSGEVKVMGHEVVRNPKAVKRNMGYLPEQNPLYPDMYVREYLVLMGSLYSLKGSRLRRRISEMVNLCGLGPEQNKKIGALSKGYRQRVGLAQALIHDPEVLILDEPTTGLDPNQLVEIRNLIKEVSKEKTVIFSTHLMQEVKALCNRVIIINWGQLVADNTVNQLTAETGTVLKVEFQNELDEQTLSALPGLKKLSRQGNRFVLESEGNQDLREPLFKYAAAQGWVILGMQREEQNLEDIFQKLTQKESVGDIL